MAIPKWLEIKKSVRKKSDKAVKKTAKKLGARVVSNSGACWNAKGDLKTKDCLFEHKMTEGKQMVIKELMLKKIFEESAMQGKYPVFIVEFPTFTFLGEVRKK